MLYHPSPGGAGLARSRPAAYDAGMELPVVEPPVVEPPIRERRQMRSEIFDVVVAGCGVAGLSAAVSAAEQGARVAVLERAPKEERGGQSRYTEAYLRIKCETEITDDFETHIAENGSGYIDPDVIEESARPIGERAGHARSLAIADPDVIQTFADNAGPTVQWLKRIGGGSISCRRNS
jgi:tricarballylate dehydrogenase